MDRAHHVKTHFDAAAPTYGENFANEKSGRTFEFRKRLQIVSDWLQGRKGRLLECACGTGEITHAVLMAGKYEKAVICDISAEMLSSAKRLVGTAVSPASIDFVNSEIFTFLEKETNQFEVVLCLGLIAHTGQLERLLQLVKPRLAANSCLVLQSSLAEHVSVKFTRFISGKRLNRKLGYDIHYFTYAEIENSVKKCGMKITAARRYNIGLPFGDKISRPMNYFVERLLEPLSATLGSECIMLLEHA
jgi:2-polyprenyl-3-methyl-5-hydroxy-6-metoxy-1,4-benzoquinol methylase